MAAGHAGYQGSGPVVNGATHAQSGASFSTFCLVRAYLRACSGLPPTPKPEVRSTQRSRSPYLMAPARSRLGSNT